MKEILGLLSQVRKLKTEKQLSLRTELATLAISSSQDATRHQLESHEKLIKGITRAHAISWQTGSLENTLSEDQSVWHATIQL